MEKQPVPVPAAVYEGLEAIRLSGYTNMFDRPRVIELAEMMGYEETAAWFRENRESYAVGLFSGLQAVNEGERRCAD